MRKITAYVFILLTVYMIHGIYERLQYKGAFEKTKVGDSLQETLARFGRPDFIEARADEATGYDNGSRSVCGATCWLRLSYVLPFSFGTTTLIVDFGVNQKVIHLAKHNSN